MVKKEVTKKVTVRPMGARAITMTIPKSSTVKDVLEKAKLEIGDKSKIVAGGIALKRTDKIGKYNELLIIPTVKGGAKSSPKAVKQNKLFVKALLKFTNPNNNISIKNHNDCIRRYEASIIQKKIMLKDLEIELEEKRKVITNNFPVLENLKQLTCVKKVELVRGSIRVITKDLKMKFNNEWFNLGPYIIYTNNKSGRIRAKRIKGSIQHYKHRYHHPYIAGDGDICYGRGHVMDQVRDYEYSGRIDLVIMILWDMLKNLSEATIPYCKGYDFFPRISDEIRQEERMKEINSTSTGGELNE